MKIPIIFEDKDVVVVNKPTGLNVHPDGKSKEKTLVDWILQKYPSAKNVGEPMALESGAKILRPGIVHRIDRDTTGCLIIAKNKKAYAFLKEQFQNRKVHKIYHAFVYGSVKDDRGMIDRAIGRSPNDVRKWSAQRGARGEMREAVTYFKTLARKDGVTFLEVMPKTGRTHQIRVHFTARNHAVLKDPLYAPRFFLEQRNQLGFKRLALHARELEIMLPSGTLLKIVAPYPKDFEAAVKKMTKK
ncbi:MAG: RluA family pseudouridine synthase [Patescibacteria group bacterium]|nr:RluA family pseudouridine synthase [Patescibacteria group bacterium]MDE1945691.1 RluA family pseudouridine synthase [Patescibacteria group bacterium]